MTETDLLQTFLIEFPLTERWLDDIIDVLLKRSNGTAHVRDIAKALWGEHKVREMEATVTRRLNDFCSDAYDFKKSEDADLFERVEPATYRLRSFPKRPNIYSLVRVQFADGSMEYMWKKFCRIAEQQKPDVWASRNTQQRLDAFAKWMKPGGKPRESYERIASTTLDDL